MTAVRNRTRTHHLYDALDQYENWRVLEAGYSTKTWAGEKSGLLGFVDFMADTFGAVQTAHLTYDKVSSWWINLGLTLAESTRATRLHQLRSFLGYCVKRGWLASDPSVLLRAVRPIPALRDRLDADELLSLTEVVRDLRDRALLALATNLGLRGGEIKLLRVGDVDLAHNEIRLVIPKTRESDLMPVTAELAAELGSWLGYYQEHCPVTSHSYLIPSRYVDGDRDRIIYRHDRPIGKPERVVQDALAQIGWEDVKGEGVHTVRRSVARVYFDMIEDEESFDSALLATMTLLHHKRSDTTLRYIGRDRATLARDRILKGKPFLTKLTSSCVPLRAVE